MYVPVTNTWGDEEDIQLATGVDLREPRRIPQTSGAFPLSPQQHDVLDWVRDGRGSAFVEAVAGSGKTTTLVEACAQMHGSVALAAFNNKIVQELREKMRRLDNVRVGTFHSFGFAAWRRIAGQLTVDADGKRKAMLVACKVPSRLWSAVALLVSLAKQTAVYSVWKPWSTSSMAPALGQLDRCFGIFSASSKGQWWDSWDISRDPDWENLIRHYDVLLRVREDEPKPEAHTIKELVWYASACVSWSWDCRHTLVDFDDMLWLPIVAKCEFYPNDWVLVDEAQDTNVLRRMIAARMMRTEEGLCDGGRSLWVGDRHQAIYGFSGADASAVDTIQKRFNTTQLPLTVTFRCSKAATKLAQTWVSHITAHENNLDGSVETMSRNAFLNALFHSAKWGRPQAGDAILCRNTKPLVSLAFTLLRHGIPCHVEGRDIGKSVLTLLSKLGRAESTGDMLGKLEDYRDKETLRLLDNAYAIEAVNDRVDTVLAILSNCDTVDRVYTKVDELFCDTGARDTLNTVTLSTVHKAKGREWSRVFILGWRDLMPSPRARKQWERVQEANLQYVAVTRTKDALVLLPLLED